MVRMRTLFAYALISSTVAILSGQTKQPLQPKDYGTWETISSGPGSFGLSPNGKWLEYQLTRSNRNNELRIKRLGDNDPVEKIVAFGTQPAFSSDSRWLAYGIGASESEDEKLRKEKKPVHRKLGLMNLTTGEQTVIENIESFAFSPDGAYLAMRRYAPERPDKKDLPDSAAESDTPVGSTFIVRTLAKSSAAIGDDAAFGNVSEYAWQDLPLTGHLLAFCITADDRTGDGVQLFDPQNKFPPSSRFFRVDLLRARLAKEKRRFDGASFPIGRQARRRHLRAARVARPWGFERIQGYLRSSEGWQVPHWDADRVLPQAVVVR